MARLEEQAQACAEVSWASVSWLKMDSWEQCWLQAVAVWQRKQAERQLGVEEGRLQPLRWACGRRLQEDSRRRAGCAVCRKENSVLMQAQTAGNGG